MNAKTVGILILLLVLGSGTSFGQPVTVALVCLDTILTDTCGAGNPLPDGTVVQIFWDSDSDGPDETDPQPPVGDCPTCCNFNSFTMNGETMFGLPGRFLTDPAFSIGSEFPHPRWIYVRVPVCDRGIVWTSQRFAMSSENPEIDLMQWTCGSCAEPGQVTGLTASQDLCDEIHVQWNATPNATGYHVYRDGVILITTSETHFNYFNFVPGIYCYSFQVQAVNESGAGPISNAVQGCHARIPDSVTGVDATDDLCNVVVITWNPAARAESYQIHRNGVAIATVASSETRYEDHPPIGVASNYGMRALNECGASGMSVPVTGRALATLPAVAWCNATTNLNDRVVLNWSDVTAADGYVVQRTEADAPPHYETIGSVLETPRFVDITAAPGVEYMYVIRAFNAACGIVNPSPPVRGRRVMFEPIVFGEVIVTTNISGVMSAEAADLDADGDMDVVAAGMFANKVAWYENNGSWGFTEHELITGWRGARAVDVGDIDGDGDLDIVAVAKFVNEFAWWEQTEQGFVRHQISSSVQGASDVDLADMDLDHDLDILTAAATSGEIALWTGNAAHEFTRTVIDDNMPGANCVNTRQQFALLRPQVFASAFESGEVARWRYTSQQFVKFSLGFYEGASCIDANLLINSDADSLLDYYFCATGAGVVAAWDNVNGLHMISEIVESPRDMSAADMDHNRQVDLLLASGSEISWWRNTPNRFYRNVICDNLPQASFVKGLDADGDGDMDVLCAGDNEIRFYLSTLNDTLDNVALAKQPEPDDNRISSLPSEFALLANYPNPFNAVTNIQFALPEASHVNLSVFDITGRMVATISRGDFGAGYHTVALDASALSSGVYFYRLEAGKFVDTKKMVMMK